MEVSRWIDGDGNLIQPAGGQCLCCGGIENNRHIAWWCAHHEELVSAEHWFNCRYARTYETVESFDGSAVFTVEQPKSGRLIFTYGMMFPPGIVIPGDPPDRKRFLWQRTIE
jgi:hypothetical protein